VNREERHRDRDRGIERCGKDFSNDRKRERGRRRAE
jgi:hypothetical protein